MGDKLKIDLPIDVKYILDVLNRNGYEAYIVGGSVRDSLLGKTPSDWDICTSAKPNKVIELFNSSGHKTIETGLKHGTITIVIVDEHFEVTTFRMDGDYSDGRRPDSVQFTDDIVKDLSRRDFTINAMAYNEKDGLVDPYNGLDYLNSRVVRCVGNPNERFQEDGLRMLRAIRFASQLGFKIDRQTAIAIVDNRRLLRCISQERVREELNKILISKNPSGGMTALRTLKLLDYIIPELNDCYNFNQHNPNHDKDVFEHIMSVLDTIEPKLELRLAALFHDIGKPNTFTMDEDGIGHFYSHHKESARICREVMKRLKYSNKEIEYVSELVYYHMTRYEKLRTPSVKKFINKVGVDRLDDLFKLFIADRIGSKAPYEFDGIYKLKFECERVLSEKQPLDIKDLAVNGYDLMKIGIPQGKEIGDTLKVLLDAVLEDFSINDKDTLLRMAISSRLSDDKSY